MTIREVISWLAAIGFFVLWMMCQTCNQRVTDTITVTTTDTLYRDTGSVRLVSVPVPVNVYLPGRREVDSFFTAADIDTLELMADYFATRSYAMTWDTSEVKISLSFAVHRNAVKDSLSLTVANVRPTVINTTTTITNPVRRLGIDLIAGYGYTPQKWQPFVGVGVGYRLLSIK